LAKQHAAVLYLDEAHAVGLLGPNGYGLSTTVDLSGPSVVMGTFSKALGGSGGYVACDARMSEYLINKAAGFIYSTANSPMVMGAVAKAWEMVPLFARERSDLFARADALRARLQALGFNTGTSASPIIPLIHRSPEVLCAWQDKLTRAGIRVSFVRPPSVPPHAARLRIALNCTHTDAAIDELLRVLSP
jgi:8-amino-7-oxononanoate synthase